MILLPMEIINNILSYRETHPVAKLIENRYNYYEKIMNEFFTHAFFPNKDYGNPKYLIEYRRLYKNWIVHFIRDSNNYHWIIKNPYYNPAIDNTYIEIKSSFISEIPVN